VGAAGGEDGADRLQPVDVPLRFTRALASLQLETRPGCPGVARRLNAVQREDAQEIGGFLRAAQYRLHSSLTVARELLEAGFVGPSLVWSVRSVEIFLKYFVLTPIYYAQSGGGSDWTKAVKKASTKFGSSSWAGAMKEVEKACGPLDPMLMEDGEDAYV
jgi:hypothetical protein